ncbi:hypothetical protein KCU65_g6610, partial [Aureobasidium melanogenum]
MEHATTRCLARTPFSACRDFGQALHDLESQLDQIDLVPESHLGPFARLYLRSRGNQKRLRETPNTRTKFLARRFLEVLGYGKDIGHTKSEVDEKTRMVKAQRMTAKAVKLLADVLGSGSLLLMRRSVWLSALDQMSEKTIKPLLEELAENEPGLREVGLLAGENTEYVRNKGAIVKVPKVVICVQELSLQ